MEHLDGCNRQEVEKSIMSDNLKTFKAQLMIFTAQSAKKGGNLEDQQKV